MEKRKIEQAYKEGLLTAWEREHFLGEAKEKNMENYKQIERMIVSDKSFFEAQRQTIAELQEVVTRIDHGKDKILQLREIIGGLQKEILKLRKQNHV